MRTNEAVIGDPNPADDTYHSQNCDADRVQRQPGELMNGRRGYLHAGIVSGIREQRVGREEVSALLDGKEYPVMDQLIVIDELLRVQHETSSEQRQGHYSTNQILARSDIHPDMMSGAGGMKMRQRVRYQRAEEKLPVVRP